MSHFKILGGDFSKETSLLTTFGVLFQLSVPRPGFTFKSDTYELKNNLASVEQITEENKTKVLSKAGWTTLGAVALGPVGLIAGLLFGGNTKYICMAAKLKSGQEFLAECDLQTYQKFYDAYLETRRATEESYDKDTEDEEEIDDLTDADDSSPIDTAPPSHSVTKDPAALLQQLKELKEEGIISEDEYRAKARKIFDSI